MKTTNIALCSFFVFFCVRAVTAESDMLPKEFKAYAGGGWAGFHYVELEGDTLLYWQGEPEAKEKAERIKPPVERWSEFRRELDAIGVWRWQSDYSTRAIFDATHWTLEVNYPDRSVKTGGDSGVFPDETGAPTSDRSLHGREQYTRYVKALRKLLSRDTFPH